MGDGKYRLRYNVSTAGRYYLKFNYSEEGTLVNVTGATTVGIDNALAEGRNVVKLTGNTLSASVPASVYAVSGQLVGVLSGNADGGLVLARGLYIVKTAGATQKVLVK